MQRYPYTILVLLIGLLSLQACSSRPLHIKNVAKGDIDLVADAHLQKMNGLMKELTVKLYKRTPRELHKQPNTIDFRLAQLFSRYSGSRFVELDYKRNVVHSLASAAFLP